MPIECLACGKTSNTSSEFFEVTARVGWKYICRECAGEIGIKNFLKAGFHTNISLLKKYTAIHPEAQYRLEILENELNQENQQLVDDMKSFAVNIRSRIEQKLDPSNFTAEKLVDVVKNKFAPVDKLSDEELIKRINRYVVKKAGIILTPGEKCFYQGACNLVRLKNVVTGMRSNSVHIGGSGAFGMYMGTGTSQRIYDRNTVEEKYPGNFYITCDRMVCDAVKLPFEIKLTDITSLTFFSDGLNITVKDKSYVVETGDAEKIKELIEINNEGIRRGLFTDSQREKEAAVKDNAHTTENEVDNSVQLIREYKKLYDEGIITEQEFEAKKKSLLGL